MKKIGNKLWFVTQLLEPLRYLSIGQGTPNRKLVYDWVIPFIVGGVSTFLFRDGSDIDIILNDGGIVDYLVPLFQLLSAFSFAALAAVATFSGPGLDCELPGHEYFPVTIYKRGKREAVSRRQLYCYCFGYISLSMILFILLSAIAQLNSDALSDLFSNLHVSSEGVADERIRLTHAGSGFVFVFYFLASHILVAAFLGLSFLTSNIPDLSKK